MASKEAGSGPGYSVKTLSLIALCFQSAIVLTLMHYSRVAIASEEERYSTAVAVLLCEGIKCVTSVGLRARELVVGGGGGVAEAGLVSSVRAVLAAIASEAVTGDSWKLGVPAVLYVIQNTSVYIALSHLDSATFQVISQSRIVITALLSTLLLGRKFSRQRWLALTLLALGIIIVQLQSTESSHGVRVQVVKNVPGADSPGAAAPVPAPLTSSPPSIGRPISSATIGLLAVFTASGISSLAGVYLELVLKTTPTSLWTRNIQLSLYSLFPAIIGIFAQNFKETMTRGMFRGFSNPIVLLTVFGQAMGGLLVSMVLQYADNILKSFATSIAILVSVPLAIWLFDFQMTLAFAIGGACVIASTLLYSRPDPQEQRPSMMGANGSSSSGSRPWLGSSGESDLELAVSGKAAFAPPSSLPQTANGGPASDYRIVVDQEYDHDPSDVPPRATRSSFEAAQPSTSPSRKVSMASASQNTPGLGGPTTTDRTGVAVDLGHHYSSPHSKASKHTRIPTGLDKPIKMRD